MVHFLSNRISSVNKHWFYFVRCLQIPFWHTPRFCLGPFVVLSVHYSLIIGKHKGIKFHFYADDSQVYMYLSHKNASAAFENLNRCLDDVKECISTSKLKMNHYKTELIIFGLKRQRDKLNACFPIDILGSPL